MLEVVGNHSDRIISHYALGAYLTILEYLKCLISTQIRNYVLDKPNINRVVLISVALELEIVFSHVS